MENLDELMREMDFEFFATGEHLIDPPATAKMIMQSKAFFLDVRNDEEVQFVALPFAANIPVCELPDRLDEIPEDRLVIIFCSSRIRAGMVYTYLLEKGFVNLKAFSGGTEELVHEFKPDKIRIKG